MIEKEKIVFEKYVDDQGSFLTRCSLEDNPEVIIAVMGENLSEDYTNTQGFEKKRGKGDTPLQGLQAPSPAHMASFCGLNCISAVGRPPVSTRWAFLVVLPVRSCGWVSCGPMQPMGAGEMAIGT